MVQIYRGTDTESKYTDTKEGRWEIRIDVYTTLYKINN